MNQNELIAKAKEGDDIAMDLLIRKYSALVSKKAAGLFLIGGDRQDLIQEGMIGLFKAILTYDEDAAASFDTYASILINRHMLTAIRGANRNKHRMLNDYVSLYFSDNQGEETEIKIAPADENLDPQNIIMYEESAEQLLFEFKSILSSMENEVLDLLIEGDSLQQIEKKLNRSKKSVENAVQRIKVKVMGILNNEH